MGPNFDKRLEYIVDELCEVFSHSNVEKLMNDFYKKSKKSNTTHDPVIHFYEDFLKEYDPDLRKMMGAYYTPTPVVRFMTRSVDEILKKEFELKGGLSDTNKLEDGKTHRVQVLDPAVGTGTFISAVIREIYKKFKGQEGRWPKYVHNDLLPRIHGFELMMAPYTIAHLKLGMAFKETGFKHFNNRLGIYLTNSLENDEDNKNLFSSFGLADSIANESKQAQKVKNNKPVMVIIGNPPYSVSSQNKGKWIQNQIEEYKKDLNERNIQPLSDDYIKFIRFAEQFIEKNKNGVVAMITNNSFIDGIIHRQMRKHLLETFDDIYILDLHGNSKKKETAPDGSKDENVFNIMQGVSINIFVKKEGENKKLGKVHHAELYGKRNDKFDFLDKNNINSINWKKLKYMEPHYFFVPKDFRLIKEYEEGFKVDKLFEVVSSGVQTERDWFNLSYGMEELKSRIIDFLGIDNKSAFEKYKLKDSRDWKTTNARDDLKNGYRIIKYSYKPFDDIYAVYTGNTKGIMTYPRSETSNHVLNAQNFTLILRRSINNTDNWQQIFLSKNLVDKNFLSAQTYFTPLYLYSNDGTKTANFNPEIANKITELIGEYTPEELFDYVYTILHSPTYRERYKEFLKIDFPRVPYPKNKKLFNKLVKLGEQLRELHLMESEKLESLITTFPKMGSDTVEQVKYKDSEVWINDTQYFGNVPEIAWNFYIGGYQPAQKWLKDRKKVKAVLTGEDIDHYQRIIVALVETDKIMKKIDEVIDL